MNVKLYFFSVLALASVLIGCTSQKKLAYFNGVNNDSAQVYNARFNYRTEPKIKAGDMLAITVSGVDPKTVTTFNLPFIAYSSPVSDQVYGSPSLQAYNVDLDGSISFPVLGKLQVAGLTRVELIDMLSQKLKVYVQEPIVMVRFMNFSVTVLGEVNRPGSWQITNERTSILDILGIAGDLTAYGRRENILISRENNGKVEFARINLNDGSIFTSPYFYVQQNDVIYVEPNSVKSVSSQNIPLYLSTVTSISSVVAIIFSISQSNRNANTNTNTSPK